MNDWFCIFPFVTHTELRQLFHLWNWSTKQLNLPQVHTREAHRWLVIVDHIGRRNNLWISRCFQKLIPNFWISIENVVIITVRSLRSSKHNDFQHLHSQLVSRRIENRSIGIWQGMEDHVQRVPKKWNQEERGRAKWWRYRTRSFEFHVRLYLFHDFSIPKFNFIKKLLQLCREFKANKMAKRLESRIGVRSSRNWTMENARVD